MRQDGTTARIDSHQSPEGIPFALISGSPHRSPSFSVHFDRATKLDRDASPLRIWHICRHVWAVQPATPPGQLLMSGELRCDTVAARHQPRHTRYVDPPPRAMADGAVHQQHKPDPRVGSSRLCRFATAFSPNMAAATTAPHHDPCHASPEYAASSLAGFHWWTSPLVCLVLRLV
jgi:hypothetical protein